MDPQSIYRRGGTANMPYAHCNTRIIDLTGLEIPETATEAEYRQLYESISRSRLPVAQALTDAVTSVSVGIAPPVAFPTETVYGLGADATNRASIAGIFAAKGRPSDNPLIVHVASREHLERLTGEPIPEIYSDLVKEQWPGPLTILIPLPDNNSVFAPNVHPGQRTIGFRVPSSKYARFFIAATGKPIAGPSANSSGKPSPTTAQHVLDDLRGKINFILDGGNCDVGVESTVVDGLHNPPLVLRPGGLSQDDLIAHGRKHGNAWANVGIGYKQAHEILATPSISGTATPEEAPRAPGMKYKHYAPRGRMILFDGPNSIGKVQAELDSILETTVPTPNESTDASQAHLNIAILTTTSWPESAGLPTTNTNGTSSPPSPSIPTFTPMPSPTTTLYKTHTLHTIPLGRTPLQIAQTLFAALRTCDDRNCHFILAEAPSRDRNTCETKIEPVAGLVNGDGHGRGNGLSDTETGGDKESITVQGRVDQEDTGAGAGTGTAGDEVGEHLHRFDAVLERMRKAASLVVS